MQYSIRTSTIIPMLEVLKKVSNNTIKKQELQELLKHEDYQFEFDRYEGRVNPDEFVEYILNLKILEKTDIINMDLRNHHAYYVHLLDNIKFYDEKYKELVNTLNHNLFDEQFPIALAGLPDDIDIKELNFIFTIGIGQSFGYAHNNGVHFDFLQLIKDISLPSFCSAIAHEIHHVGMFTLNNKVDLDKMPLESLFYWYFSWEGLAVKYCNNSEGILSKSIYVGEKNIGLDELTWNYLNNDFKNNMEVFKNTIEKIRNAEISSKKELDEEIFGFWMSLYIDNQSKTEIPMLKHSKVYSFGNEIWGIIHDCLGKEAVYNVLKNLDLFPETYNICVERLGYPEYSI